MFKIKLDNCGKFKIVVNMLDSLIDESLIIVDKNQFRILAMDPSRIAIFRMILKKSSFASFVVKKKTEFGISFNDMNKIFTRINADNSVEFSFNEEDNILFITAKKEGVGRKRTFRLNAIDIDYSEDSFNLEKVYGHKYIGNMLFDNDNFYLLEDAIKDGMIYSEKLEIITDKESVQFISRGQVGEMNYELQAEELTDYSLDKCQASFSLTYLNKIIKLKNVGDLIELHIDIDYPLKIDFELGGGDDIIILVGPLVDNDLDFEDDIDMDDDIDTDELDTKEFDTEE